MIRKGENSIRFVSDAARRISDVTAALSQRRSGGSVSVSRFRRHRSAQLPVPESQLKVEAAAVAPSDMQSLS